ncbi:MAG: hypothetical protein KME17_24850 [Cyanosarcina radialis HA8281-LM2]|nr:hypothetical protein [Cyanosarcina radialis HA8281-LM2]
MFNILETPSFPIHYGFSPDLDFCIWTLEVDGLQVFPFDKHLEGNGVLRAKGMNAQSWQDWVRKIVLLSDQRLNWHVEDIEGKVSQQLAAHQKGAAVAATRYPHLHFPAIDDIRAGTYRYLTWQEEQYQLAAAAARQVVREPASLERLPGRCVDLWNGDPNVGKRLKELWQQYYPGGFRQRERAWGGEVLTSGEPRSLWHVLQPYREQLEALELYLVAYPEPAAYLVPPASAIFSVTNRPDGSDAFFEGVIQVVVELAALPK